MKAAVLHAIDALRIEQVEPPKPCDGEVLIEVASCGVCSSDISRIKRDGTYYFPAIPGHEFSGRDNERRLFAVYPLIPCGECEQCTQGRYQCCSNYSYMGSRCDGGFAEQVKVPQSNLIPVPQGVTAQEAAMTEPAAVAMHAIKRAGLIESKTVIVIGCGTIGLIAAQIARAYSAACVIPIDIEEKKLKLAGLLGFEQAENSASDLTNKLRAIGDVVIEMVGLSSTYNLAISLAKPGGKVIFTGNIKDDLVIPRKTVSGILRKELDLLGTWNSVALGASLTDWQQVLDLQSQGRISLTPLISDQISLDQLPATIDEMVQGKRVFGKVIVNINK